MDKENRTESLKLRLTPSEVKKVSEKAKSYGLSMSEYARRCILNGHSANPLYSKTVSDFLNVVNEIDRIVLYPTRPTEDTWKSACSRYKKEVENLWQFLR